MNLKTFKLITAALGAGALGLWLRVALYHFGFDEKNILPATHPLQLLCIVLTLALVVYLLLEIRHLGGSGDPVKNFPDTPLRSMASLAAACLTAVHGLVLGREMSAPLEFARVALAMGSALCMALCALPGMFRKGVHIGLLFVISVFFAVDMLCRYQTWSGNPQLPDYTFQVFACILLTLCSYYRLAFHVGLGQRRRLLLCSLLGLQLCLVSIAGPETRAFYLGGAFWAGACICRAQPPEEEEQTDVPA